MLAARFDGVAIDVRLLAAAIAFGLGLAAPGAAPAQDTALPDFGSSAAEMIDPSMERLALDVDVRHEFVQESRECPRLRTE